MPTRRIDIDDSRLDPNERRNFCQHPEHEPPNMRVFKPGTYEHTYGDVTYALVKHCPFCGAQIET